MKTFFLTGGAGFIGSALVRLLLETYPNCQVINFDALTYAGNPDNLAGLDETRHQFVCGDVAKREAVREALPENADALFHLAAESHVDRSILSADEFIRTNVLGTQVLLDVARERGARRTRNHRCQQCLHRTRATDLERTRRLVDGRRHF